jgi:hypothetical protein
MGVYGGPKVGSDGLVLSLDAANQKLKRNALFYKWFVTNGTNPTTKAGFDAFFAASPQSSGIDEAREINWLVVADRPSYITQTTSFAWEVTGFLIITEPGEYIFNTRSDDGNELQINGQVLTSFYGGRGVPNPGDVSSPITLGVGAHPFQYRMQQGAGGAGAQVRWQRPSSSTYEVIPSSNFAVGIDNNVFPDLVGNNNGVLINGVGYNSDNGGSLVFDGVDDYTNHSPILSSGQQRYTISAWWKTSVNNRIQVVWEQNSSAVTTNTRAALIFINANWGFNGQSNDAHDKVPVRVNQWTNGTITIDTTLGTNPVKIYENGSLYWEGNTTGSASNLNVGNFASGLGRKISSNNEYFIGNIAQVSIYNRALTASEIQQNFIATRSRFGI